jgi:hypothetical protein
VTGVATLDDSPNPGHPRVDDGADRPMSGESDRCEEHASDDHLAGVEDGIGCAEVWEHLSASRAADD